LNVTNNAFWRAWEDERKELMRNAPNCTCGRKHPEKSMHYGNCPWLNYWNNEFIAFMEKWKKGEIKPSTLDRFIGDKDVSVP